MEEILTEEPVFFSPAAQPKESKEGKKERRHAFLPPKKGKTKRRR